MTLLAMRMRSDGDPTPGTLDEVRAVAHLFEAETGRRAADATVLEIGFGARPFRAFALSCVFKRVYAVDLDSPVLSVADLPRVFAKNGFERGIKSLARHMLFDARLWKTFHRDLKAAYPAYSPADTTFIVGSAADAGLWARLDSPPDLIFSTDVFEHIPHDDLAALLAAMRTQLAAGGIVLTRPMIFTGISGGHDLEWYPDSVEHGDSTRAWGHLTDPAFRVNTYVNRLCRADYVTLFQQNGFDVVRDHAMLGRLGEHHLTPARRADLHAFDDYELFSNRVEFLLR